MRGDQQTCRETAGATSEAIAGVIPVTLADFDQTGWREIVLELVSRVFAATTLGVFAYLAFLQWRLNPGRITLILIVIAASLTVGLSLFSRVPASRDWSPVSFVLSVGGTYYFVLFQLTVAEPAVPEWVAASIQIVGLTWEIFAKLSLNRRFGIVPANRGIACHGAYRFVRHPIYLGYVIVDAGFLLANFSARNCAVVALQLGLQTARIYREERILSNDVAYQAYRKTVRYRIIPGLF